MRKENWNQAKEIFYSTLNKLPHEREKFLIEVCGDDSQLFKDVEILLKSYKSDFLEQPLLDFHKNSLVETSQFQSGDQINHYIILRTLGRGGMGEVYLAKDKKLDRLVAIKFLHQGSDDKAGKRLLREARSAAKLDHPNIGSVYEVGETADSSFIVMQYIEGETLDELIKAKSISVSESISITLQIAEALQEAHSHNIIHRDIKPSNIIIDLRRQVKVLDFSLAKKVLFEPDENTESILSEIGVVAGTVAYMSPEQARGKEIDARSDIWSLGVVCYEMIAGQTPFAGESKNDVIAAILTKKPPNISKSDNKFSLELERIINKSLAKNRDERYDSIKKFSADLIKFKDEANLHSEFSRQIITAENPALVSNDSSRKSTFSEVTQITDDSNKTRDAKSFIQRNKIMAAALLIAILSFGGIFWRFYPNNSQKFESFAPDSRSKLQISTLFSAKRKPNGAIFDVSFSPDGKLISFLLSADNSSDIYVKQTDQGEPIKITDGKWINQTPVWSPDGQRLAFVSNRDNKLGIWTESYLGGTPVLQTPLEQNRLSYQLRKWSNDGKRIYFEARGSLKTIELDSGKVSEIKLPEVEISGTFNVSNDEKMITYIVVENAKEQIWIQSLETGEAKAISKNDHHNWSPVFFPDNKRIAYSSNQNGNFQIYVSELNDSEPTQITFGDINASLPVISPDGLKMIYVSETDEANIFSLDLKTREEIRQTSNTKMQLFPNISTDNEKMVFQVTDDKAKIDSSPLKIKILGNETEPAQISQFGGLPKWSPNGDSIAFLKFSGLDVNIWKIDTANLKEKQLTSNGVVTEGFTFSPYNLMAIPFSWSSDSKKLLYASKQSGFYNLWTIDENGSNAQMLTDNNDKNLKFTSPLWSTDESRIAFNYRLQVEPNKFKYGVSILSNGRTKNIFESDSQIRLLGWLQNETELLAAVKKPEEVELVKISTNSTIKPETLTKLKGAYIHGFALSSDLRQIAFSARRNGADNIFVYSINGKELQLTSNLENTLFYSGITWESNGANLFYSKQTGGMQISMISDSENNSQF